MTTSRYIRTLIACSAILLGAFAAPASAQELSREERIKILDVLRSQDAKWEETTSFESIMLAGKTATELEKLELPPLSVFLDAAAEHATIKTAQLEIDEAVNELSLQKRDWWNWFRVSAGYSYGRTNVLSNSSNEYTPLYQTTMASAQHSYNVGGSFGFSFGDIINRKKTLKKYKFAIEKMKYNKEIALEERRMSIVESYNEVTVQLATIRAKAETAALYNAEMKMAEYEFIQGTMSVGSLAIERGRRAGAVVAYEEARVSLHNAITMLEMLTNVKIVKD